MGLIDRFKRAAGPRPGTLYSGPAAWCADPGEVPWPGFYALTDDGKSLRKPVLRLVGVDDAPGDPYDGTWHLEVARKTDPPQRNGERIVELEAHTNGRAEVAA